MKVVVVGAGPAGVSTALLLARSGIEVTLLEQEQSFERVFRGEGLMPSGADALLQMGLRDVLHSIPSRRIDAWSIWLEHREAFVIPEPSEALGDRALRVVSQPALLQGMVEQARRYPSFQYAAGARVRGLLREGGRVAGVQVAGTGGTSEVFADLVIGCDGRSSQLRSWAGLELTLTPEQYDVLWCKLPAPPQLQAGSKMMIMVAGGKDAGLCYTSWDGRLQFALILPKGNLARRRQTDWLAAMVEPAPPWLAEHVFAHREEVKGPAPLNVIIGRCREWTAPGLLLLGDAAHPMSPVRAQGVNLALRDAIVAANHLGPVRSTRVQVDEVDAAARAVQAEREPEIVRAQALQRAEAAGQVEALGNTWLYRLARSLAPMLGRHRWAQALWLQRQRELRFGVTKVELR